MPIAPDPEAAGPYRPELRSIEVDLQGLMDFAALVSDEMRTNLSPYADRIIAEHVLGVPFGGRSASTEVHLAAWDYHACLTQAIEALRSYIDVSEIFISAAERIATAYGDADALSAARAQDIDGTLTAAFKRLSGARPDGQSASVDPFVDTTPGKDLL